MCIYINIYKFTGHLWEDTQETGNSGYFHRGRFHYYEMWVKGDLISTVHIPCVAFWCCTMYIKYLFIIGNQYKLENNSKKTQLKSTRISGWSKQAWGKKEQAALGTKNVRCRKARSWDHSVMWISHESRWASEHQREGAVLWGWAFMG